MKMFLLFLTLCSPFAAMADLIQCGSTDLRNVSVGTQCMTSKQAVFEIMARSRITEKEVWKDHQTGLIWGDNVGSAGTLADAIGDCGLTLFRFSPQQSLNDLEFYLPSLADFNVGASDGFEEVLPNINAHFWSYTPYTVDDPEGIFTFYIGAGAPNYIGQGAGVDFVFGGNSSQVIPTNVRCVAH
jgi:hypothetical protein